MHLDWTETQKVYREKKVEEKRYHDDGALISVTEVWVPVLDENERPIAVKGKVKKVERRIQQKAIKLVQSAMKTYGKRLVPGMRYKHGVSIDDSVEPTMSYLLAVLNFLLNQLLTGDQLEGFNPRCPFQIDFCIAYGPPHFEGI